VRPIRRLRRHLALQGSTDVRLRPSPSRGRCPKGGWGPQQVRARPHPTAAPPPSPEGEGRTVRPIRRLRRYPALQGNIDILLSPPHWKVPEGRMGPPASPCEAPSVGCAATLGPPSKSRWGPIRRLRRHLPLKGKDGPWVPRVRAGPHPTAAPPPCSSGQHRCSTQAFPFRGRCPKGGWGPQQVQAGPHPTAAPPPCPSGQHRCSTQAFPFRGRCPKGGWGPQQVHARPHPTAAPPPSPEGEGQSVRPIRRLRRHLALQGQE